MTGPANETQRRVAVAAVCILLLFSLAFSLGSFVASRKAAAMARQTAAAVESRLGSLDGRLTSVGRRVDGLRALSGLIMRSRLGQDIASSATGGVDLATLSGAGDLNRLEDIVKAAGLEELTKSVGKVDPDFLQSLHREYESRKSVSDYRAKAMARNSAQHQADGEKYEKKKLMQLYDIARTQSDDSQKALQVMLDQYPEANATGMVLAERALQAAMTEDTATVEQYYNSIVQSENFSGVVTDMGIEAVPALQTYLITQYLKEGRTEDASSLLASMEKSYGDSYIADRGQNGEPEFVPISQVVQNLQQEIQNVASGNTEGLGSTSGRVPTQAVGVPGGRTGTTSGGGGTGGGGMGGGGPGGVPR